jgi:ABC-2 type transport system ATP-binding protein
MTRLSGRLGSMRVADGRGGLEMTDDNIIEIRNLRKVFRLGFLRKRIEAVRDVSLDVREGDIFGLLGPNGAGKTTTIKAMMSLIRPTSGEIRMLGKKVPDRSIYRRVGFLPENPYFYDYLKPLEFLEYQGALFGLGRRERFARAEELLALVGLKGEEKLALRKFSKGMLQRIGLAQALIGDPKLLVLDEPMSGLDPIGRKEMRDLLLSLKEKGMTILFSSHILSDVEMMCDRVAVIDKGVVRLTGDLASLLRVEVLRTTFEVENLDGETLRKLREMSYFHKAIGRTSQFEIEGEEKKQAALGLIMKSGGRIVSVIPHRETLEDIFIRDAIRRDAGSDRGAL